jgi:hypothetical protein
VRDERDQVKVTILLNVPAAVELAARDAAKREDITVEEWWIRTAAKTLGMPPWLYGVKESK